VFERSVRLELPIPKGATPVLVGEEPVPAAVVLNMNPFIPNKPAAPEALPGEWN
jgi:hypothetical protein